MIATWGVYLWSREHPKIHIVFKFYVKRHWTYGSLPKNWFNELGCIPWLSGLHLFIKSFKLMQMVGWLIHSVMQSEVNFLGRLSHPNLVKLLGYCSDAKELLLVYEFMQKGSLENHLFRSKKRWARQYLVWWQTILIIWFSFFSVGNPSIEPLSWHLRLKIVIGAARGLAFLHTSDKQVIYRDFKASNILLDGVRILLIWSLPHFLGLGLMSCSFWL